MYKIMFVCLGNICRSAMAKCIMSDLIAELGLQNVFEVDSAGTSSEEEGNGMYPAAESKLREKGVHILPHTAKQLREDDYDKFDAFVCMEERNAHAARRIFCGDPKDKVKKPSDILCGRKDIADPWYSGDFDKAYVDIYMLCKAIVGEYARFKLRSGYYKKFGG